MPRGWEDAYRQAMFETDQHKLIGKVDLAIPVLRARLQDLGSSPERLTERQRVSDALLTLDTIRRIELKTQI
jgi:hypothetical protein